MATSIVWPNELAREREIVSALLAVGTRPDARLAGRQPRAWKHPGDVRRVDAGDAVGDENPVGLMRRLDLPASC